MRILGTFALLSLLLPTLPTQAIPEDSSGKTAQADVFTVEGDVVAPKRVEGKAPDYPEAARKEKVQGQVIVASIIDRKGKITEKNILSKDDGLSEDFDQAVFAALNTWRFEPATLHGKKVAVHYQLTFNFRLDSDKDPG